MGLFDRNPFRNVFRSNIITAPFADLLGNELTPRSDTQNVIFQGLQNRFEQNRAQFLSEVEEDETISDITKEELRNEASGLTEFTTGNAALGTLRNTFLQAQEGVEPKFKFRQTTQALFDVMRDRPGRSQALVRNRGNNSMLG